MTDWHLDRLSGDWAVADHLATLPEDSSYRSRMRSV